MRVLHLHADTPKVAVLQPETTLNSRKAPTRTLGAPHIFDECGGSAYEVEEGRAWVAVQDIGAQSRQENACGARRLAAIGQLYDVRAPDDDVEKLCWAIDGAQQPGCRGVHRVGDQPVPGRRTGEVGDRLAHPTAPGSESGLVWVVGLSDAGRDRVPHRAQPGPGGAGPYR